MSWRSDFQGADPGQNPLRKEARKGTFESLGIGLGFVLLIMGINFWLYGRRR